LALILRKPSAARRVEALAAIAQTRDRSARPLLRYVLEHASMREAASAATGLGEIGDQHDATALLRAIKRLHWPIRGAAAYALLRLTERGMLKPYSARTELCALVSAREPHVRANAAAALAVLAAPACESPNTDPAYLLHASRAPIVRAAAARWLAAAAAAGRVEALLASRALERCATTDLELSVRAVCKDPALPNRFEPAEVRALGADAATPLRNTLVSVRLPDGGVFLGVTDANGQLPIPAAPFGSLRVEDPTLPALEPG
jgi:HEAT repeat protein